MPSITPKKSAAELSWDTFPELPPDAENWVPDPDSIARPGRLADPRLNKDPYAEQKKAALKRDARLRGLAGTAYSTSSSSVSSNGVSGNRATAAGWPVQMPRSYLPQLLALDAPATTPHTDSLVKSNDNGTGKPYVHAVQTTPTKQGEAQGLPVSAGTRVVSAVDSNNATLTANKTRSIDPAQTSVRDRASMPGWAGPPEKLLGEHAAKATPAIEPAKHLPPHLRTAGKASKDTNPSQQTSRPAYVNHQPLDLDRQFEAATETLRSVSGHSAGNGGIEALADDEDTISDGALAWKMATTDIGTADAKEGLRMKQALFPRQAQIVAPCLAEPFEQAYQREIDVKLYRILEDEMDVEKMATRAELFKMNNETFASHLAKVKAAHKKWWNAERQKKLS
ncbi:hypothetical protein FB567DRAFT_132017 [Paraphoma chrysanthemicola]|uniref:Uncharacterized protein n=1 Tax=Paraphoma chrysanthemicola TaxID=798071 RepID=A0A8K0VUS5_9PLEO|nr:hypothetical protein FB567DRAFT_132017 [Paraphoma chrysanthemicola]